MSKYTADTLQEYIPATETRAFHGVDVAGPSTRFWTGLCKQTSPRFKASVRIDFVIDAGEAFSKDVIRHIGDALAKVPALKRDIVITLDRKNVLDIRVQAQGSLDWSIARKHEHATTVSVFAHTHASRQKDRALTLDALSRALPAEIALPLLQTSALDAIRDAIRATLDERGAKERQRHAETIAHQIALDADTVARTAIDFDKRITALTTELEEHRTRLLAVRVVGLAEGLEAATFSQGEVIDPRAVRAACKHAPKYLPAVHKGAGVYLGGLIQPSIPLEDVS